MAVLRSVDLEQADPDIPTPEPDSNNIGQFYTGESGAIVADDNLIDENNIFEGDADNNSLISTENNVIILSDARDELLKGGRGQVSLVGDAGDELLKGGSDRDNLIVIAG